MNPPRSIPKALTDELGQDSLRIRKVRKSLAAELFWQNVIAGCFFLAVLAGILGSYWVCAWVARQPQDQPFDFQYSAAEDWPMSYAVNFPEEGLPGQVRKVPQGQRILPTILIDDKPAGTPMVLAKTAAAGGSNNLPLRFIVPKGAVPGTYEGTVRCTSQDGKLSREIMATIEVLDTFANFRAALGYYLFVTALFLFWCYHNSPSPFGKIHTLEQVSAYQRARVKDSIRTAPVKRDQQWKRMVWVVLLAYGAIYWFSRQGSPLNLATTSGLVFLIAAYGVLLAVFFIANPFRRARLRLKRLHPDMPEGVLVFNRVNLFSRSADGVSATLWILEEPQVESGQAWKHLSRWPASLQEIANHHTKADQIFPISRRINHNDDPEPILAHATRKFAFAYSRDKE